jgi:hypothetical protein
MHICLHRK